MLEERLLILTFETNGNETCEPNTDLWCIEVRETQSTDIAAANHFALIDEMLHGLGLSFFKIIQAYKLE